MGDLGLSAFDPIFYFHHAFVDYVWELFRRNQVMRYVIHQVIYHFYLAPRS